MASRKMLLKKTIQVSGSTLASRILGLIREILMANYLGVDVIAEAFITAFKIPNSLRKIFAEGALSAAFIPTFVKLMHQGKRDQVSKLTTLGIVLFEGSLFFLCLFVVWKAEWVIRVVAPGWYTYHPPLMNSLSGVAWIDNILAIIKGWLCAGGPLVQVTQAELFLRILIGFILFLSTSALLSGALQAVHHFFTAALSPVLLNIFFILGLAICIKFKLYPTYLCLFIMLGGLAQLGMHVYIYFKKGFYFARADGETWQHLGGVWKKLIPCLISAGIMEIYILVDTSLASFLPTGAIALIYYANRFMQIPLSVVATALSTILLPQFSRISSYAPRRLGFYLLESTKLIFWAVLPVAIVMWAVADKIFLTLFLSKKFTLIHVYKATAILHAFLIGLCFFSLNKILLNMFYGLHDTFIPMIISLCATVLNMVLSIIFMKMFGAFGIALATSISGIIQTIIFVCSLHYFYNVQIYIQAFFNFLMRYSLQLLIVGGILFLWCYIVYSLLLWSPIYIFVFFIDKIGFWLWFLPSNIIAWYALYKTRNLFKLKIFFIP